MHLDSTPVEGERVFAVFFESMNDKDGKDFNISIFRGDGEIGPYEELFVGKDKNYKKFKTLSSADFDLSSAETPDNTIGGHFETAEKYYEFFPQELRKKCLQPLYLLKSTIAIR